MGKEENNLKLRDAIPKPDLMAMPFKMAVDSKSLENFEEYLCVVVSIDDEIPMPYYDEALVWMKYYKEQNVFTDCNGNDWGEDEVLFVYLPIEQRKPDGFVNTKTKEFMEVYPNALPHPEIRAVWFQSQ